MLPHTCHARAGTCKSPEWTHPVLGSTIFWVTTPITKKLKSRPCKVVSRQTLCSYEAWRVVSSPAKLNCPLSCIQFLDIARYHSKPRLQSPQASSTAMSNTRVTCEFRFSLYCKLPTYCQPVLIDNLTFWRFWCRWSLYHVCAACWEISDVHYSTAPWCKTFSSFLISTLVPLALNLPMKSYLRSRYRCQTVVSMEVRIQTLPLELNLVCQDQRESFNVRSWLR